MNKKIIVLTGPTASGKTKIAINLAKTLNAQIICADSRIVYKDFDIVSAKPTFEEREGIEHHLIDIIEANQEFSAGDFVKLASEKIDEIRALNKNVIITGGTWFYIKSLLDNQALLKCPSNKKLREELAQFESGVLWEKLNKLDSLRANKIHPNNKDKIIRSIEMCLCLNQPVSKACREENKKYDAIWYMNDFNREELYKRINLRVDEMIKSGLEEEFQKNRKKYPNSIVLENTIGYREFFDFEKGITKNLDETVEKIKQHTRNFAKRQLTYFRSRNDIKLIHGADDILNDLR